MLEICYILLSVLMSILLLSGYKLTIDRCPTSTPNTPSLAGGALCLGVWLAYLWILSRTAILTNLSMPPKVPLLLLLPIVIFTIWFYRKYKNSRFIMEVPLEWTSLFQTYRIAVELLLAYTFYKGIIPVEPTFEGYNFDILMGISAPLVGYIVYKKRMSNWVTLVKVWNVLGIAMVLFVAFIVATSFYAPSIWGHPNTLIKYNFLRLPYLLIAGYLAPAAIFVHIVALMRLCRE